MQRGWFLPVLFALSACGGAPRLQVDPTHAELPFGARVHVDGRLESDEWAHARKLLVNLPDGRTVGVLLQRDRSNFHFAFDGIDGPSYAEVYPEILFDLWGNGGDSYDSNDWWFSIARELCWTRGGYGEGDCGRVLPGWEANTFPLARGQAVEVAITFAAIQFGESYDGMIGLAIRFVDESGRQVAIWPLRAEVRRPGTWAPVSLRH